ncbi:sortase [Candidatus Saccharibacteria bacterium]|nr:MAG: sortase [Candidatus Saccharibacteria bacterium]
MSDNPLFPQSDEPPAKSTDSSAAAVELIRSKVARAYADEPSATEELAEVKQERTLSKHQVYLSELSSQGKSLAEIQTAWHHYYTQLPDAEKHEVWQEFYAANQHTPYQKLFQKQVPVASRKVIDPLPVQAPAEQPEPARNLPVAAQPIVSIAQPGHVIPAEDLAAITPKKTPRKKTRKAPSTTIGKHARRILDKPAVQDMKRRIASKVSANGRLETKHHMQSLAFGIASGVIVLVIIMFSFFNQFIIAPFIQPSRNVSATPIIIGASGSNFDASVSQIIIPKINVQIPLDFSVQSNDEKEIETALDSGVVHYPTTVKPGQNGNAAFFGHSSNNIFNPGKYKFAFVLLRTLTTGDTFYITYDNKVFAYQVVDHEIVPPTQVNVLQETKGKTATAALITCDPPGTTTNRLVVWGEQISPSVASNTAAPAPSPNVASATSPQQLPDNGPTLWSRFVDAVTFWN